MLKFGFSKIRKALLKGLLLFLLPLLAQAQTWEVGIVFLGGAEPAAYQKDLDQNMLELARLPIGADLHLGILREFSEHVIEYSPQLRSPQSSAWDELFYRAPVAGLAIPGKIHRFPKKAGQGRDALLASPLFARFAKKIFRRAEAKRLLIIYGHGEGYAGLRSLGLPALKKSLQTLPQRSPRPPLDLLWFNSCFMASLEAAYELREQTKIMLASQEAEFSAGAPFAQLALLPEAAGEEKAAIDLARGYIESYSYSESGSQRRSVLQSSATIVALRLSELEKIIAPLKEWQEKAKKWPVARRQAAAKLSEKWRMEKPELIDLGQLALWQKNSSLSAFLAISKRAQLHSNPRLLLKPPVAGAKLLFGYGNWRRGHEQDKNISLPLAAEEYLAGPKEKKWPALRLARNFFLAPFTVGQDRFDYLYLDPRTNRPLGEAAWLQRDRDYLWRIPEGEAPLILAQGYTQGIGSRAEIYTGLNLLNPFLGLPSTDYLDTEFFQATGWGGF